MMGARVLSIVTVPMQAEGITLSSIRYAEHFDNEKVSLTFLAKNEPGEDIKRRIESAGASLKVIEGRNRHPVKYVMQLAKYIRCEGFRAVHARGSSSTLALEMSAAFLGGAKKRIAHSDNSYSRHPLAHRLLKPLLYALTNTRLACGKEAGRWLFGKRPFEVINIGVDAGSLIYDPAARAAVRQEWGVKEGGRVIGCVANLTGAKNHSFLLRAFAEVNKRDKSALLALIGDGKLRKALEEEAETLGIADRVLFTGSVSNMPMVLSACDIMALPSFYEGFPSVLLEWQCSGLRALVSDRVTRDANVSGLLEYLPIDDPALWADKLLSGGVSGREENSKAGADAVIKAGYGIEENAKKLQEIYLGGLEK